MKVGKTGWNLGAEVGPDFLLGERLARGEAFLRSLGIPWILSGLSPNVLVHKVGNLHLAPVGLDHSDRTIAVAQEPGDLLCLFQGCIYFCS